MKNVYEEITNRMIEQLEQGVIPWKKPWSGRRNGAVSYATGRPYSLINQMILAKPGEYATFNQVKAAGGKVNKGPMQKSWSSGRSCPGSSATAPGSWSGMPMETRWSRASRSYATSRYSTFWTTAPESTPNGQTQPL